MQRMLLARECGDDVYGIDDILSARWARLNGDLDRETHVAFCDELSFVDIDRPAGSLVLCGGGESTTSGQYKRGCAGVYQYALQGEKLQREPLVSSVEQRDSDYFFTCGKWFPYDPAMFITGGSENGEVAVWDSAEFATAARFLLGEGSVSALEMSYAPGARSELIAAGTTVCRDVVLVDMESGAFTHRLQGHSAPITDVAWAPRNPHMLASVDSHGDVRLFDVRRAGRAACLVEFDEEHKIPNPDALASNGCVLSDQRLTKKPRFDISESGETGLLGMGCAWNSVLPQRWRSESRGRLKRRSSGVGKCPTRRVRFTPDGSSIVTADEIGRYRVWDVMTGRMVTWYQELAHGYSETHRCRYWQLTFEISQDGFYLLSNIHGNLVAVDIEDGRWVNRGEHPNDMSKDMTDMVLHPLREEAITVCDNRITYWSPT